MANAPARTLKYAPHLAMGCVGYVTFAYAAVPDVLMATYDVGFTAVGLLMSAALVSFVLVQVPASHLVARFATTRLLFGAVVFHAIFAVALDFASSYETLLVLRACWGLAGGFVLSVGATHIARLYAGTSATHHQGVFGGMLTFGGAIGFAAAPTLIELGLLHSPGALLSVPALVACWRERHDAQTAPSGEGPRGTLSSVLSPPVVLASLCYIAIISSYITLSTFITAFAADLNVTGPLNVAVLLTATAGRITGGTVVWRWSLGDPWFIGGATAVAAVCFGALAVVAPSPLLLILPVVAMLAVSVPFGAVFNVTAGATSSEGSAIAVVVAAGNVAALILPAVTGALRDATGEYASGFVLLAALNLVALGAATLLGTKQFSPQVQHS
ncbi:MFS transporter [Haladaptatus sp. DJG-WS-42]|uniref:MFS transporter n=1 Tax=Haladaptatus sp. DJG-WS-42 TaxID=3120516 RepID=UPI0030CD3E24